MPNPTPPRRSSLGVIVLFQLYGEPMHVYRMQKLLEAEGKDRVVNVRSRASLYQTIERLQHHGLVAAVETERVEGYPDRTVYAITAAGRETARQWLREMLHSADGDYPEFVAALSLVFCLPPDDARAELELRAEGIEQALADAQAAIVAGGPDLPRLFTLEEEYRTTVLGAELGWLRGVIADLDERRLTWSEEWLRELADALLPHTDETE